MLGYGMNFQKYHIYQLIKLLSHNLSECLMGPHSYSDSDSGLSSGESLDS